MNAPGLDLDRLAGWFAAAIPGAGDRLSASLIAGGRSNLTYVVSDGASTNGSCAGRRSATCSPPPTTWPASTA